MCAKSDNFGAFCFRANTINIGKVATCNNDFIALTKCFLLLILLLVCRLYDYLITLSIKFFWSVSGGSFKFNLKTALHTKIDANYWLQDVSLQKNKFWQNHLFPIAKFYDYIAHYLFKRHRICSENVAQILLEFFKAGDGLTESIWHDSSVSEDSILKWFSKKRIKIM